MMRALLRGIFALMMRAVPPIQGLKLLYVRNIGRWPNFSNPRTFNERLQVYKLDRDPRFPDIVDKIAAKPYVASRIGSDWIIPTLWHGAELPPRAMRDWPTPYVVKLNNGSSKNLFVFDREDIDWESIERQVADWKGEPMPQRLGEWPYHAIEPRLLLEPFIGTGRSPPLDYKFFVFGGLARFVQVDSDREIEHRLCYYDMDWAKLPFALHSFPLETRDMPRPPSFERMRQAAETLAMGFPFLRVDFYEIDGQPKFGEMTLFPNSGFKAFVPAEWDRRIGEMWPAAQPLT